MSICLCFEGSPVENRTSVVPRNLNQLSDEELGRFGTCYVMLCCDVVDNIT